MSNPLMAYLSPKQRYWLTTLRRTLEHYPQDVQFRAQPELRNMPPIPSLYLRHRVAGVYDIEHFHNSGRKSRQCFEEALGSIGRDLREFESILDFGVGCSRIMRWMEDISHNAELYGTDVDPPGVRWSQPRIQYATYTINQPLPPLVFPDNKFDLVYSHSVFTHLDEQYQDAWLAELKRVCKPGAILLLTVHGAVPWEQFIQMDPNNPAMQHHIQQYEAQGFQFITDDGWTGIFPDFYHSMFHKREYVEEHWGQFFTVQNYLDAGMLDYQDIVVLQN